MYYLCALPIANSNPIIMKETEMTMHQFFKKYLIKGSQIAHRLGYSREWLAGLYSGRTLYTKPVKEKHIKNINQLINEIGREMATIKFTDEI
jgi:hypothetical protein